MRRCFFLFVGLLCLPLAAQASPVTDHWRALTKIDVEAAHRLLADNHPAAVPETGDKVFTAALEAAYKRALAKAATVTDFPGYVATMGEFAHSMGDGHIWSNPLYQPVFIQWAGIVVEKRGDNWVIAHEDKNIVGEDIAGAHIVSCGGVPVDDFARQTVGRYLRVWSDIAARVLGAPRLLVDEGNPFVKRPDTCIVNLQGRDETITLHWKKLVRTKFAAMLTDIVGHAGYGIRPVGTAYWIAIEGLEGEAQPVIDAAKKQEDQLRAAPYVIVDLRDNGGGSDAYGRRLAEILYGEDRVRAVLGPYETESGGCQEAWRATQDNINAEIASAEVMQQEGNQSTATSYRRAAADMKAARLAHRNFTASLTCATFQPSGAPLPPSLMHGTVIVLTDAACFSSCIDVVDFFKKMGATLAGQPTGSDTRYSEVREITLPSGLSTFSTLQAIMPDAPPQIGPFAPDYPYDGDISDTAALEQWITKTVVPALK